MLEVPLLVALLVLAEDGRVADDSPEAGCTTLRTGDVNLGDAIAVVIENARARPAVEQAIEIWRRCSGFGTDIPRLVGWSPQDGDAADAGVATSVLQVRVVPGYGAFGRCGEFRGRTIALYVSSRTASGKLRGCGSLALNLAHELGHALGLADSLDAPRCERTIMAELSSRNGRSRELTEEECRLAGSRWLTLAERSTSGVKRQPLRAGEKGMEQ